MMIPAKKDVVIQARQSQHMFPANGTDAMRAAGRQIDSAIERSIEEGGL